MRSIGRLFAAAGRRALLRMPVTLELGCIAGVEPWGSDTVRKEGTRRGRSFVDCEWPINGGAASEEALGGSSGVLASEEISSSSSEPGEPGMLSICSSGVTEESGVSDMVAWGRGQRAILGLCLVVLHGAVHLLCWRWAHRAFDFCAWCRESYWLGCTGCSREATGSRLEAMIGSRSGIARREAAAVD